MIKNRSHHQKKQLKLTIYQAALVKGPAYFEYQDYQIPISQEIDKYEVIEKIGRGKYSDVYKAVRVGEEGQEMKLSVLKILKPIRLAKIRRQVKIMLSLKHENIISLQAVMLDTCSKSYILAFDYIENIGDKMLLLSDKQMRFYLKKLVEGLVYCHASGIIHRDIKPQNVLIDRNRQVLKIIDWGLADYYLPQKEFNVRVASRYYKSPQLLLNNSFYDYSMDIWSVGCWFASLMFRKPAFFRGADNVDQLFKIGEIMGTAGIVSYVKKYSLKPDQKIRQWLQFQNYPKISLQKFRNQQNEQIANDQAIDLLEKMLTIDHSERISAEQILKHPYLADVE